jgi:hypothetical protein
MSSKSGTVVDDAQPRLSWRIDPKESFSDWTLEIVRKNSAGKVDTYHVHKCILAFGPRRSDYFATLFQQQMQENAINTSRVELDEDGAADLFPLLLDHIYSDEDMEFAENTTTFEQASRIYELGEYFQIPSLLKMVAGFFEDALTMSTMVEFLQWTNSRQNNGFLLGAASKKCASLSMQITPDIARQFAPDFFIRILRQYHNTGKRDWFFGRHEQQHSFGSVRNEQFGFGSARNEQFGFGSVSFGSGGFEMHPSHASDLVVASLESHQESLTEEIFAWLTVEILPSLTPKAALAILLLDSKFAQISTDLSTLQLHCIGELKGRLGFVCSNKEDMVEKMKTLPSNVLVQLLALACFPN